MTRNRQHQAMLNHAHHRLDQARREDDQDAIEDWTLAIAELTEQAS